MRRLTLIIVLAACGAGCGYREYMDRFENTLAEMDYKEKMDQTLGAYWGGATSGLSFRLPKRLELRARAGDEEMEAGLEGVFAEKPEEEIDKAEKKEEEPKKPEAPLPILGPALEKPPEVDPASVPETAPRVKGVTAVFETPETDAHPVKIVVFVTRKTKDVELPTLEEFTARIFDPVYLQEWMGEGAERPDVIKLEPRNVPAGPKLKDQGAPTMGVLWIGVNQTVKVVAETTNADGTAAKVEKPVQYVWKVIFLEHAKARGAMAFRIRKDDYYYMLYRGADGSTVNLDNVLDLSVSTAKLFEAPPQEERKAVKPATKDEEKKIAPAGEIKKEPTKPAVRRKAG